MVWYLSGLRLDDNPLKLPWIPAVQLCEVQVFTLAYMLMFIAVLMYF